MTTAEIALTMQELETMGVGCIPTYSDTLIGLRLEDGVAWSDGDSIVKCRSRSKFLRNHLPILKARNASEQVPS